ncbi:class I SAM-dependent methyltransferase [Marimonas lutisalis]|uniref:SAM-dependent methyltransferase n=1 Tax=Marimonas lutisalis TaxID=2545756 RepID=UPI0010F5C294|nr:SAM-dependent methyltransferase [Marimonas lutisalis]
MTGGSTKGFMAMKGAGYYSGATIGAKHVMDNAAELVLGAVERMAPADDGSVFRATDMGAADGGTSLAMWGRVLADVREKVPSRPIEIVYTDLPRNDFSQTFQNALGLTSEETYVGKVPDVYVLASATSFHEGILPPGTLDLGFSATASHYIAGVPCNIADHVHMVGAAPGERAAYEARGAEDWERMLLRRTEELKPGGRLALFNFGIDEEGRYLGNTGGVNMFDTFALHWAALRDEGVITAEEFAATNFPQCYRTEAQFVAPLLDETSPVWRAGLRLEHVESRVVRCPFEQNFTETGQDPADFARDYIPTLRSWSEPTFVNGLSDERTDEEKAAIIDEFYGRYEKMVAGNPQGHAMDYVHIYLVCRKEG